MFGENIFIPDKGYLGEYDDDGNIISNNKDDFFYIYLCDVYFILYILYIIFTNDATNSYYKFILANENNYDY